MWPFTGARRPSVVIDPFLGDETARQLHADAQRGDWRAVREVLVPVTDPDDREFYINSCAEVAGEPDWILQWIAAEPPATLPTLVRGAHAIHWAWEARGSGAAKYVSEQQFKLFFRRLKIAEDCLDEVTERDPADANAWSYLITTAMGRQLGQEEALRRFHEVTARHRWHHAAHQRILQQLCAKWGGSHETMHAFASRTVADMPPGHTLGALVPTAHFEHWMRLPDGEDDAYITQPAVLAELHAAADKSIRHPAYVRRPGRPGGDNIFALSFHLAGDHAAAADCFDLIGDRPTEFPWSNFNGSEIRNFLRYRAEAYDKAGRQPAHGQAAPRTRR